MVSMMSLIKTYQPGLTLPAWFYTKQQLYDLEIKKFWTNTWQFCGYTSQLSKPGSYFTTEFDNESVIINRNKDNIINAHYNVCRHRGSRIIPENTCGIVSKLVCPYHRWTYDLNGKLIYANGMTEPLCDSKFSLKNANVREVGGLIFIHYDDNPILDIEPMINTFSAPLASFNLEHIEIAHSITYNVKANWKLLMENFAECLHCMNHPEYVKSNYDLSFIYQEENGIIKRIVDPKIPDLNKYMDSGNFTADNNFPGQGFYRITKQALKMGWKSETLDGNNACKIPLVKQDNLSSLANGTLRLRVMPNFWAHIGPDYAMISKIKPINIETTEVKTDWLVHKNAELDKDYTLDKLIPFWDKTNVQDWKLCEETQKGIKSKVYTPGILSKTKESGVKRFNDWYINHLEKVSLT